LRGGDRYNSSFMDNSNARRDREVIVLCVRWYLRLKLNFRALVEMMTECALSMVHTTIMRWVQRSPTRKRSSPHPDRPFYESRR
jgi:transposase-like protein